MELTPLPKCYYTPFGTVLPNDGKDLPQLEYVYEVAEYLKMDKGFLREFVQRYNYRGLEPEAGYDKYKKEYYEQMEVEYSLDEDEAIDYSRIPAPMTFEQFKKEFYSWFSFDDTFVTNLYDDDGLTDSLAAFDINLEKFCYMGLFVKDYIRSVSEFVPKLNASLLDICKELCEKIGNADCVIINKEKVQDSRKVMIMKNALQLYHLMLLNLDWHSKSRESSLKKDLKILNIDSFLDIFYKNLDFSTTNNFPIDGLVYKQALGYKLLLPFFNKRKAKLKFTVTKTIRRKSGNFEETSIRPCKNKDWIISEILWNMDFVKKQPEVSDRLQNIVNFKYNIKELEIPHSLLYFDKNIVG